VPIQLLQAEDPVQGGAEEGIQALYAGHTQTVPQRERVPSVNCLNRMQLLSLFI
jgi:hypothetical protein